MSQVVNRNQIIKIYIYIYIYDLIFFFFFEKPILRKLKTIMLAIWQKSKSRWFWANKQIKCNVNLVFQIKNWANLKFPWPNALQQLWWTNSGLKFWRDESKIKLEICKEKRIRKPQLIPLLSSTTQPPSHNLLPKPMHKLTVMFIEGLQITVMFIEGLHFFCQSTKEVLTTFCKEIKIFLQWIMLF